MEISAAEFKAKCLKLLDEVAAMHEPLVITKRGRPVTKLIPTEDDSTQFRFGYCTGTVTVLGDLIDVPHEPLARRNRRRRLALPRPAAGWVRRAMSGLLMAALESTALPRERHADSADRFLIAEARVAGVTVATADRTIIDYGRSGHVRVLGAWGGVLCCQCK